MFCSFNKYSKNIELKVEISLLNKSKLEYIRSILENVIIIGKIFIKVDQFIFQYLLYL